MYEGQREASDQKRVFILSRSAFAGIQRNGVTAWSGDVLVELVESYKRQIPAGLNFAAVGHSLLDDGHRRIHHRAIPTIRRTANCSCAGSNTARSARFSGCMGRAPRSERVVVVWAGSAEDPDELRPAAIPADAVHLLAGVEDDERELHADAAAGDGFRGGHAGAEYRRSSSCLGRRFW